MLKLAGLLFVVGVVTAACGGGTEASPTAVRAPTATPTPAPQPTQTPAPAASVSPAATTQPASQPATPTPRPTAAPVTPTPAALSPKYGGTMAMRVTRVYSDTLDTRTATGRFATIEALNILNNLAVYDPGDFSKITPDLAEKWEVSQDGKVWTFSLRGDVRWHDGAPFTSKDVTFTFDKYLNPEIAQATVQKNRFAAIGGVEASDLRTVKFTLKELSASFSVSIFDPSAVVYPSHQPVFQEKWKSNPVGTGPFTFSSRNPNVVTSVVRNAQYFKKDAAGRALPYLDRVDQYVIPDRGLLLGAFYSGKLSCLCGFNSDLFVEEIADLRKQVPDAKVEVVGANSVVGLYLNSKAPLANQKVRQALSIGIDRKKANAFFHDGSGYYPPSFLVPAGLGGQWALPEAEAVKIPGFREPKDQDVALAKQLLREAGVDPATVSVNILALPKHEPVANAIDDDLIKLGFKRSRLTLPIDPTTPATRGEFDLYITTYAASNDPSESLQTYVLTNGSANYVKWSYPQIDSLLQEQDRTIDPAKRRDMLWDIQRQLYDLAYHVPVVNEAVAYATHAYVEGHVLKRNTTVTAAHRLDAVWLNR